MTIFICVTVILVVILLFIVTCLVCMHYRKKCSTIVLYIKINVNSNLIQHQVIKSIKQAGCAMPWYPILYMTDLCTSLREYPTTTIWCSHIICVESFTWYFSSHSLTNSDTPEDQQTARYVDHPSQTHSQPDSACLSDQHGSHDVDNSILYQPVKWTTFVSSFQLA